LEGNGGRGFDEGGRIVRRPDHGLRSSTVWYNLAPTPWSDRADVTASRLRGGTGGRVLTRSWRSLAFVFVAVLVGSVLAAGCAASRVEVVPEASRVRVGSQAPSGDAEQIGAVTAQHGGGCGLYGSRGTYEGAFSALRNKAAQLGADYVQIVRVREPRLEGACMNQAFVIDSVAYRLARRPTGSDAHVGLNGTYGGDVTGTTGGQALTMRVTFTLVQTGDQVVGTWNTTAGASGTVTAKVAEGRLMDFLARQVNPCDGRFQGAAVIEGGGSRLRGNYAGRDCASEVAASFEVTRP